MASRGARNVHLLCTDLRTFHEDLGDFGVAGTESAVDLEAVGVIEERATQREEDFLRKGRKGEIGEGEEERERERQFSLRRDPSHLVKSRANKEHIQMSVM